MIEDVLSKIARQIMALNEETLTALLPRYKERMLDFAPTGAWEESVVIYFLINGLRIKNSQFNDKIKEYMGLGEHGERCGGPHVRPRLRLVKYVQEVADDLSREMGADGGDDQPE
ncbi:MAG: hypothetical protein LBV21_02085 [Candidatus Adiutrix sp.]|jgi:hypothetical protein|nr:hypothetical protein [Candidatus Adiutrix sp.]